MKDSSVSHVERLSILLRISKGTAMECIILGLSKAAIAVQVVGHIPASTWLEKQPKRGHLTQAFGAVSCFIA